MKDIFMQPQNTKFSSADISIFTGSTGLAAVIFLIVVLYYGIGDGSSGLFLLLIGPVLAITGITTGIQALKSHTPPIAKAVIGLITGITAIGMLLFALLYVAMWATAFTAGY